MAINKEGRNDSLANLKSMIEENKQEQQQGHQQQQQQHQPRYEGMPFTSFDRNTVGFRQSNQILQKGGEEFEQIFKVAESMVEQFNSNPNKKEQLHVVRILKEVNELNYSAIAIAMRMGDCTAIHLLMVEATGNYPEPEPIFIRDGHQERRYDFIRPPSFAMDRKYATAAIRTVRETLGLPREGHRIKFVDSTTIYNEFKAKEEIETGALGALIINAIDAVFAECVQTVSDFTGVSIAEMLRKSNGYFDANITFNNGDKVYTDQSGMPIRQDVCIALTIKSMDRPRMNTVNQDNTTFDVVHVYGYIDMVWQAVPPVNNMYQPQAFQPLSKFIPVFVITNIQSPSSVMTDHLSILALGSVAVVKEDRNWLQSFLYKSGPTKKGEVPRNDIGMLGIEGGNFTGNQEGPILGQRQYGTPIDTNSKEFTPMALNNLVNILVEPGMLVAIDVPESGPTTWFTSIFKYIADGMYPEKAEESMNAKMRLYTAITALLGGAEFVDEGNPMFVPIQNLIHGGYYREGANIHDIRRISNYLAVAGYINATGQDPARISHYNGTLFNPNLDEKLRAAERFSLIDEMAQGTCVVKQYYKRLIFNGAWLDTLIKNLKLAGFKPDNSNFHYGEDMFAPRGFNLSGYTMDQNFRLTSSHQSASSYVGGIDPYVRWF